MRVPEQGIRQSAGGSAGKAVPSVIKWEKAVTAVQCPTEHRPENGLALCDGMQDVVAFMSDNTSAVFNSPQPTSHFELSTSVAQIMVG